MKHIEQGFLYPKTSYEIGYERGRLGQPSRWGVSYELQHDPEYWQGWEDSTGDRRLSTQIRNLQSQEGEYDDASA